MHKTYRLASVVAAGFFFAGCAAQPSLEEGQESSQSKESRLEGNYDQRILETATTFANENDGTWGMADWDHDNVPDLAFIKTANTPSGLVEIHIASAASNYQSRILETATTFGNENDGTWSLGDADGDKIPDLIFIKTSNTPGGNVEVHIASGASNFQQRIIETGTTFANENDGTWLMRDFDHDGSLDLIFIKTSNTPGGNVEVHIASGASSYAQRILEVGTTFANENDGQWRMRDGDGDNTPDLVFIKTSNTPSGRVEVHVASAASSFQQRTLETATTFANEDDGTWVLPDYNHDGIADLGFIKTSNTPSGDVEIHIAAGQ